MEMEISQDIVLSLNKFSFTNCVINSLLVWGITFYSFSQQYIYIYTFCDYRGKYHLLLHDYVCESSK